MGAIEIKAQSHFIAYAMRHCTATQPDDSISHLNLKNRLRADELFQDNLAGDRVLCSLCSFLICQ